MGDISRNFSRHEFVCRCGCGFNCVDIELVQVLEKVRDHFGAKVIITGPNRCKAHNDKTPGAADNSKHTKGIACDFKVVGVDAHAVAAYLEGQYKNKYGIGRYNGRTHVDVRPYRSRWDSTGE